MDTVLIGVCTAKRPQMLRRCLDSLAVQQVPDDVSPVLAVIDNETEPNNRAAVETFAAECPFPVRYVHEPRAGIPIARNRVLDEALAIGAEWIAMIDDDETAAPDWLAMLMAPEYRRVPVLSGWRIFVAPEPAPFWYTPRQEQICEGQSARSNTTNNVRFHTGIVKAGFRFNEKLALTRGSDGEYFTRVHRGGYEIRRTRKARTFEAEHPSRHTFRRIVQRRHQQIASNLYRQSLKGRPLFWRYAPFVPGDTVLGAAILGISPLVLPVSRSLFKRAALYGGRMLARGTGRAAALAGVVPQPYRRIDGY